MLSLLPEGLSLIAFWAIMVASFAGYFITEVVTNLRTGF